MNLKYIKRYLVLLVFKLYKIESELFSMKKAEANSEKKIYMCVEKF